MNEEVIINRIDTLGELKNKLEGRKLIYCDEYCNEYAIVYIRNSFEFGIAYADYGMDLMFGFDDKNDVCYIGSGQNLLLVDFRNKEILFNKELFTVILDVISIENTIYVLCDLELICYSEKKEKWKMGFRNWITNYKLLENNRLWFDCEGDECIINLPNGTVE